jgi:hypothetical protein
MSENSNDDLKEIASFLKRLPEMEPSSGFREKLWQKIEESKEKPLFPWIFIPRLVFAVTLMGVFLIAGIRGGRSLNNKEQTHLPSTTESLNIFSSSFPTNSVEAWVFESTLNNSKE